MIGLKRRWGGWKEVEGRQWRRASQGKQEEGRDGWDV